jgi:hypothetical protein
MMEKRSSGDLLTHVRDARERSGGHPRRESCGGFGRNHPP